MRLLCTIFILSLSLNTIGQTFPGNGVVYNQNYIPKIYISINPDDLDELYLPENWKKNDYYQISFIFKSQGVTDTVENVGLRLRGHTARSKIKKSFKVSFNEFESGRRYRGLKKLNLNGEPNDPSMIRSRLCIDLFKKANIAVSRTNHVELYINNDYYGLYQNTEHIDGDFLKKYFGNNKGNLYKGTYPCDLSYISDNPDDYKGLATSTKRIYELRTNKSLDDYTSLAEFIIFLNNSTDEDFNCRFAEYLNVVDYLKIAAIDVLTGNWDGYIYNSNNFYMYDNRLTNRMEYIPYDLDNTWGLDWMGPVWATRNIYNYSRPNQPRPLFTRLMDHAQYRDIFTWYVKQLTENELYTPQHIDAIEYVHNFITTSALNDPYRPLDYNFTDDKFLNALTQSASGHVQHGVLSFAQLRKQKNQQQLENTVIAPFFSEIKTNFSDMPQTFDIKAYTDGPQVQTAKLSYVINGVQQSDIALTANEGQKEFDFTVFFNEGDNELEYNIELTGENGLERTAYCENKKVVLFPNFPQVVINEVQSKNDETIADEHGEYVDWIELYNAGEVAINLRKYYLTDKHTAPMFWKLPDVSIDPGKHLVFWADGKIVKGAMHTNFSVKSEGEKLYLFKKENNEIQLIDQIEVPALSANHSYGRESDGSSEWIVFTTPTPKATNKIVDGIEEHSTLPELYVFPNPTSGNLNFPEVVDYQILDITGRVLKTGRGNKVRMHEFSPGLYLVATNHKVFKVEKL